jgi:hypothetical protein
MVAATANSFKTDIQTARNLTWYTALTAIDVVSNTLERPVKPSPRDSPNTVNM